MVAASYFEAKELIAFGVSHSAFDVQNPFVEDNEKIIHLPLINKMA